MKRATPLKLMIAVAVLMILTACAGQPTPDSGRIPVVATTSILADIVSQVGGDHLSVTTLVPPGSNEHEYQPAPRDIAAVSDAALIFEVGLGLEEFMATIVENAGTQVNPITVSEGIQTREFSGEGDDHLSADPHVWLDPANVVIWVQNIESALAGYDPAHADAYHENSRAYIAQLNELDAWIAQQTAGIPAENRRLVTDHMLFGYFAEKYGFEVIGAVIPSYSAMAQPSAQQLAQLEDAIRQYGVKVILVGNTVNPALANRIAADTGIELVPFYTGSLSEPTGPAPTYLDYMRYNVSVIVDALAK